MDFIDQLQALAGKINKLKDSIETEEATKNAFILPFINALGYNVFDPTEVIPEYTADLGTKKGEKVDYAIFNEEKLAMLFECKWCGNNLKEENASQLYRYFSVTEARIAVLTNGIIYRFYSDLDELNKMDEKPFLELDLLNIDPALVNELKKLSKSSFDLDDMLSTASDLKYTKEINHILSDELKSPSEDFVKFFASRVYSGRLTQSVREQFTDITKRALHQFINSQINQRLKSALASETESSDDVESKALDEQPVETTEDSKPKRKVDTTEEEMEAFYIIKSILRSVVELDRIAHRDTQNHFGVLLDDNNRKPICRFHFNAKTKKYIGLFDENKNEDKIQIDCLDDIYKYADQIRAAVSYYD